MNISVNICYEIVTSESAEHGDFEDHGFFVGGWFYSMNDKETRNDIMENRNDYATIGDLYDIVKLAQSLGITEDKGTSWFYSINESLESDGQCVNYSLHFNTQISESTKNRILHLINTY